MLKAARAQYHRAIRFEKQKVTCHQVLQAQRNPQELYHLTKSLTGTSAVNPLPTGYKDVMLAEEFSFFFYNKVDRIQQDLLQYDQFSPPRANEIVTSLEQFEPITTKDVCRIVFSLSPKSCELDPLPARLFRGIMDYILDFLTILINHSLTTGTFITSWKTSVL